MEYQKFKKIPRLSRDCTITEKIDGRNTSVIIMSGKPLYELGVGDLTKWVKQYCLFENDDYLIFAGSKNRWLDTTKNGDNCGFAKWVQSHAEEILTLGEGQHCGEFWGNGVQRGYGLKEKRFSLFNVHRWCEHDQKPELISVDRKTGEEKYQKQLPKCLNVVPTLYKGAFCTDRIEVELAILDLNGSVAAPGYMNPEGLIIYHSASGQLFKKTIENDEKPKGK